MAKELVTIRIGERAKFILMEEGRKEGPRLGEMGIRIIDGVPEMYFEGEDARLLGEGLRRLARG